MRTRQKMNSTARSRRSTQNKNIHIKVQKLEKLKKVQKFMKKKKTLEFKLPEILRRFKEKHLFFAVSKAVRVRIHTPPQG